MTRVRWVVFELPSQLSEINPQVMSLFGVGRTPHFTQQFFAAHQLAAVAHQHLQHPPFCRGQMHLRTVLDHFLGSQIHRERLRFDDRFIGLGRCGGAPDRGAQSSQQLVHPEWLGHIIVGAGIERLHFVRGVGARGQHDDRRVQPTTYPAEHFDTRHVRQPEIQNHHLGPEVGRSPQRIGAVGHGDYVVAAHREVDAQRSQDLGLVVDHQNPDFAGHRSSPAGAARSTTTVNPPPGVSVAVMVPPIASTNPRATDNPSPTPLLVS